MHANLIPSYELPDDRLDETEEYGSICNKQPTSNENDLKDSIGTKMRVVIKICNKKDGDEMVHFVGIPRHMPSSEENVIRGMVIGMI